MWVVLALFILVCVAAWYTLAGLWMAGFQPPQMAAAQYSHQDVVGNLGGLPVRLPRYAVEYVEYDGDPGWGGKRQGPVPVRTMESQLTSFGFDGRYPDRQLKDSYAMENEKRSQSIYRTMWIRVGVRSGEIYPKDGFLDRLFACLVQATAPAHCKNKKAYWWDEYQQLPHVEHGLTAYALKGVEPRSGKPAREQEHTKDVFVAKDGQGRVKAYISCYNVGHEAAPCGHGFSMEYNGMRAEVEIRYRRGLLPHWRDIQSKVTQVLLGFVVRPGPVPSIDPIRNAAAASKP